ncbi:MAG: hypothetical protein GTO62_07885, partial [Planctomycetales bacterium]|nr:hypothetical protein [Planctomycetales bacterium]NIP69172.1 hypothetical protein [Planctomycetales bacterium]
MFSPEQTRDDDDIRYLFWKTAEAPEAVPSLDEVREQVVRAWQLGAGRDQPPPTA